MSLGSKHVLDIVDHFYFHFARVGIIQSHTQVVVYWSPCDCDGSFLAKLVVNQLDDAGIHLGVDVGYFKSSACQRIVHCFPSIVLLVTHQS
jgi:hypothetical protein